VFWAGSAANPVETVLAIGLGILGVVFLLRGSVHVGLVLALTAIVLEHVSRIRVTVSRARLVIHYGHLGLVRQSVRVADIVSASSFELIPIAHGGWGYRGSLKLMRRAAVVVRRGSALRLELVRNRLLAITVDDAKTGAELLSGLRQPPAKA
jgi:hypothetical protein